MDILFYQRFFFIYNTKMFDKIFDFSSKLIQVNQELYLKELYYHLINNKWLKTG